MPKERWRGGLGGGRIRGGERRVADYNVPVCLTF